MPQTLCRRALLPIHSKNSPTTTQNQTLAYPSTAFRQRILLSFYSHLLPQAVWQGYRKPVSSSSVLGRIQTMSSAAMPWRNRQAAVARHLVLAYKRKVVVSLKKRRTRKVLPIRRRPYITTNSERPDSRQLFSIDCSLCLPINLSISHFLLITCQNYEKNAVLASYPNR